MSFLMQCVMKHLQKGEGLVHEVRVGVGGYSMNGEDGKGWAACVQWGDWSAFGLGETPREAAEAAVPNIRDEIEDERILNKVMECLTECGERVEERRGKGDEGDKGGTMATISVFSPTGPPEPDPDTRITLDDGGVGVKLRKDQRKKKAR